MPIVEVTYGSRVAAEQLGDPSGLDLVVEVRSKWYASRAENRQERCDKLCAAIVDAARTHSVGVYLALPVAAWAQGT